MNEQLSNALVTLAAKLGTTTEHLWAALLKQAAIDGAVTILQYAILAYASVWMWRWFKYIKESSDEIVLLPWTVAAVVVGVIWIAGFFILPNVAAAFLNPEYWALKEIFSAVKTK